MTLPTGTVTFLFTDIEGSTKLWEQNPEAMNAALSHHDALMHHSIQDSAGVVFKTIGDAFCAAFGTAPQALYAALRAQQVLQTEAWPANISLQVRMALHTGASEERDGDYFGPPLNRVARLLSAGHGGQVLLSQPTYELTRDALPSGCTVQGLGAHALRDLSRPEQVYQLMHPKLRDAFPPLKSLDYLPNNLPQQVTSFVGREKELIQIKAFLGSTRLLTLTGSGGAGKTRLSLQTAADVINDYPDGVWLVELASITDPALVPQTAANVLGIKEQAGNTPKQTLIGWLKPKKILLILDNCEHLLAACASMVDDLLRFCPDVQVLASSREGLNVPGEQTYRVPSLSLPDPKTIPTPKRLSQYEAVRLFIERIALVKPGFAVTNQNAPAVASVCHRVDGIPLALELAAARVRSLSVEEVNDRLDNRFRLLTGGSRTALPRQQTLRALIDWSYDLLTEPEKSLLCGLSVFTGGWTLDAAEVVCTNNEIEEWEILDLLTSLVDKSLVSAEEQEGQTRYHLLETVRQYGRDKLTESGAAASVRDKHAEYFLALAETASPKLMGSEQGLWVQRLEADHSNLRSALDWFLETSGNVGDVSGLRLAGSLQRFWLIRGYFSEGRQHLNQVLNALGAQEATPARSRALNGAGVLAIMQGDLDQARTRLEECVAIARAVGDTLGAAIPLANLGNIAKELGDYTQARIWYEESLALYRELGQPVRIAAILHNLGSLALVQSDYVRARQLLDESLARYREAGDRQGISYALSSLAAVARDQGNDAEALGLYAQNLVINRELGDREGILTTLLSLGNIAYDQGDFVQAAAHYKESLSIAREIGNKARIAMGLGGLASVASSENDLDRARSLHEDSLVIFREIGNKGGAAEALLCIGRIAIFQGDAVRARSLYHESLSIRRELGDKRRMTYTVEAIGSLAAFEGEFARAARLWAAAHASREALGTPLRPRDQKELDTWTTEATSALGDDAFAASWAEGQTWTLERAIDEALSR